ncbi:MAG TPA: RNA polymerase sigma factor [Candidatus Limnocylindrales bacterium]|nr:RNA polymerase sigma factor [Candidatus Limnocylindrales bacterium]
MADPAPSESAPDAELLRASRDSSSAFRILYDRHAFRIHAFLTRRTGDPRAALELTAETFAQAWLSRDRYIDHHEGSVAPWLFGIARHVLASSVRRHALERTARDRLELAFEPMAAAPGDTWLDGLDTDLSAALAALPDGQRRAIELRILADHAYEEVGRRLDISPEAARVRVHRGLRALRQRLSNS